MNPTLPFKVEDKGDDMICAKFANGARTEDSIVLEGPYNCETDQATPLCLSFLQNMQL